MNYILYTFIALGGALGAVARYGLSNWICQKYITTFPWCTYVVNILGCFLLGVIFVLGVENQIISTNTRLVISVGFLGAFTTFSTFSLETLNLIRNGDLKLALSYSMGSLLIGLLAIWLGISLTQQVIK